MLSSDATNMIIRKRTVGPDKNKKQDNVEIDKKCESEYSENIKTEQKRRKPTDSFNTSNGSCRNVSTYWLTRIVFLRSLAFVYFVAFLVTLNQNKQLLGKHGLQPADQYIKRVLNHFNNSKVGALQQVPSVLLLVDTNHVDWWMDIVAYAGLLLSGCVFLIGGANMFIMAALWMLYHAIVNIGQRWYGFGWESQLLETGFLAIFFCPVLSIHQLPVKTPPSKTVLWAYRWLIFRIMIGAGLIKIRGDKCWQDLTCMNYHYQTQPVPSPLSYYLHQTPEVFHKFETLTNHFVELVVPWFLLLTRNLRTVAGLIQIIFQVALILSGNLSFLNWLSILPSICSLDDQFLCKLFFSRQTHHRALESERRNKTGQRTLGQRLRVFNDVLVALLICGLSVPVVKNLVSTQQQMNTSFDSLRIVNTYGAFGTVTKTRTEIVLEGTRDLDPRTASWEEYEFPCKPGGVSRRPCLITPYHYRLDWLMWFAAFMNYQQNPWLIHFTSKLLTNDGNVTSLLSHNPFQDGKPPRYIRALHYEYTYTKLGSAEADEGQWWQRKLIGEYFPSVDLKSLKPFLRGHGWR